MHKAYTDLTSRLGSPLWYDDEVVPRYCEFDPDECDVYACWVMLALYKCQDCGEEFKIASSWNSHSAFFLSLSPEKIEEVLKNKNNIEWLIPHALTMGGDPPRHGCVGDTMCMIPVEALELWHMDTNWEKIPIEENLRRLQ